MKGLKKRKKANDCNLDKLLFSNKNSLDFVIFIHMSHRKKHFTKKNIPRGSVVSKAGIPFESFGAFGGINTPRVS